MFLVEFYSPFCNSDGLVRRVYVYENETLYRKRNDLPKNEVNEETNSVKSAQKPGSVSSHIKDVEKKEEKNNSEDELENVSQKSVNITEEKNEDSSDDDEQQKMEENTPEAPSSKDSEKKKRAEEPPIGSESIHTKGSAITPPSGNLPPPEILDKPIEIREYFRFIIFCTNYFF
jgi:hypothetical protein